MHEYDTLTYCLYIINNTKPDITIRIIPNVCIFKVFRISKTILPNLTCILAIILFILIIVTYCT